MSGALTLGILGHVDHGKTALVRALTGIETDRLSEERARGLSIVLGFAFLETARGVIDLIDVPGHEDFVRAMIAGATGIDGIVLCIAANEGVMPQTVEHFSIARLLGIEQGFVVITKTDLVDAEALDTVRRNVDAFVSGSFLEGTPVIEVSVMSGAGVDAVRDRLARIAGAPVQRETGAALFLPLDRVFTIRGFGLVATGTLRGGTISVDDTLEILPAGRRATVRALQNHNRPIEQAEPGQRVAVNLRHVGRDEVGRGDVLATPGSVRSSRRIDVELRLLPDAPRAVGNDARLRFLTGTTAAIARLRLLGGNQLAPGESSMAQLSLDREIATRPAEPFLVRELSPASTIGGGRILAVEVGRHRRFDPAVAQRLATVASGDRERILAQRLDESAAAGIDPAEIAAGLGIARDGLDESLARLGVIEIAEDLVVAPDVHAALCEEILAVVERFHAEHALRSGTDLGSLIDVLGADRHPEVVRHAVKWLIAQNELRSAHGILSLASHDPFASLAEQERSLVKEIEDAFLERGLEAPTPESVVGADKPRQGVYRLLLESGRLVRLKTYKSDSRLVLHSQALERAKRAIEQRFPYPEAFALKDIRDLLGSTRRYIVPLMEHLDATGATVRSGDLRRLRQ